MKIKDKPAVYISLAIFILISIANLIILTESRVENFGFGYEYGNIAAALAEGRGYVDVFGKGSGATGWNLPLIVYVIAAFFKVFGVKSAAAVWALSLFKNFLIAATHYVLIKITKRITNDKFAYFISVLFLFYILQYLKFFIYDTDDQPYFILIISLTILGIFDFIFWQSKSSIYLLYVMSFILPITIPTIGLGFVLIMAFLLFKDIFTSKGNTFKNKIASFAYAKNIVVFGILFGISLSAWSFRNYLVFEKFIPSKSNMWYEFYMANVLDDDGVVSGVTFLGNHPYQKNAMQEKYYKLGEMAFLKECEIKSKDFVNQNSDKYLKNVLNRTRNILLFTSRPIEREPVDLEKIGAIKELEEANLVFSDNDSTVYWTSLKLDKTTFENSLGTIAEKEKDAIIADWGLKKETFIAKNYSADQIIEGLSISFVPVLCMLLCFFFKKSSKEKALLAVCMILYFIHILPYIFVSHYLRYQRPLLVIQCIVIFIFLKKIMDMVKKYKQPNHNILVQDKL